MSLTRKRIRIFFFHLNFLLHVCWCCFHCLADALHLKIGEVTPNQPDNNTPTCRGNYLKHQTWLVGSVGFIHPEAPCLFPGLVMKTSFAYKFTTCIVHTTNEYDVTNARYVSPHFRQRFFCIPLRLNWLNKKTGGGGGFYFSAIQPRQPPYHATNRSLGRNCIDLSLPSLSIFFPQIECKEQSIYKRVCVCVCWGKEKRVWIRKKYRRRKCRECWRRHGAPRVVLLHSRIVSIHGE